MSSDPIVSALFMIGTVSVIEESDRLHSSDVPSLGSRRVKFLSHGWVVSSLATLQHQVTIYVVKTSQMRHLYLLRHFSSHLGDTSSHASVIVPVWPVSTGSLTRNFPLHK